MRGLPNAFSDFAASSRTGGITCWPIRRFALFDLGVPTVAFACKAKQSANSLQWSNLGGEFYA